MGAANGLSNTAMANLLTMLVGGAAYNPTELFLGLVTSVPTAASAGTEVSTGQMTNYARQGLPNANWEAATVGVGLIPLDAGGASYTSAPAVTFTGGTPTRAATAHAVLTGNAVSAIVIDDPGAGYSAIPAISFSGGGGAGATAHALLAVVSRYANLIDFSASTGGTGGTVNGFSLFDLVSAGVFVGWSPLAAGIAFGTNTRFTIPAHQLWIYTLCISGGSGVGNIYLQRLLDNLTGKTVFPSAPTLYPALATSAPTAFAHGTEIAYSGYPTAGQPRTLLPTASLAAAALVGANVDVLSTAEYDFPACTSGGATATNYEIYDSINVGAGNTVACGTAATGAVSAGLIPDLPSGSTLLRMN